MSAMSMLCLVWIIAGLATLWVLLTDDDDPRFP